MQKNLKDVIFALLFIVLGVLTRTVWHIAPNIEFVTALSISGAYFLKSRGYSFGIPLFIMIISDIIIGNTPIFLFTWTAFVMAWIFGIIGKGSLVKKIASKLPKYIRSLLLSEFMGVIFTLFFFLWTNFGVVLVSGMYPKTFEGVLLSYKMGLPFLVPQLIGNLIIVPTIFILTRVSYNSKLQLNSIKEKLFKL